MARTKGEGHVSEWKASKSPHTKYRAIRKVMLPDGQHKTVTAYAPTAKEAIAKREAMIGSLRAAHPNSDSLTVTQLAGQWLTYLKHQGRKKKTIMDYADLCRRHVLPYVGERAARSLTTQEILELQTRLTSQGKYRTAELLRAAMSGMFHYAVRALNFPTTPVVGEKVRRPYSPDPKDIIWTPEEMERFLALSRQDYDACRSLYYPLFYTAMATGLRRGELLALTWDCITEHTLSVKRQYVAYSGKLWLDTPKTRSGVRTIPISGGLYETLTRHREVLVGLERRADFHPTELVFPSYTGDVTSARNLRRSFDRLIEKSGNPPMRFHNLRKCAATYITQALVEQGRYAPKLVQRILGHSRIDVALEVYTKAIDADYELAVFDPLSQSKVGMKGGTTQKEGDGNP